ncbi:hypothetical protein CO038_00980 [Candidatus Pacearchaeota archaeon CG_4_9_14_0_2_um_filter_39_13]|nr:MAG: hypothetical protein CO038_00980 [Candidatus Pacearchaeota archaeon CG_4_9_14_0_2_um_filter_39_13]
MDWPYLAGFFDGEGNIHFNKIANKSYQVLCRMYSSNEEVLLRIRNFLGFGNLYKKKSTGMCELTISNKENNLLFLKSIHPYSIIKKQTIEFVLGNYDFKRGKNNLNFDISAFHKLITRKNRERFYRDW